MNASMQIVSFDGKIASTSHLTSTGDDDSRLTCSVLKLNPTG